MGITTTTVKDGYHRSQKIKIDYRGRRATMAVNVFDFDDHGHIVVYVPALDLSAYGKTKAEAMSMLLKQVIDDFFVNLFKLPEAELSKELAKYGWERSGILKKNFTNDTLVDNEGILRNFNLPAETRIRISTLEAA